MVHNPLTTGQIVFVIILIIALFFCYMGIYLYMFKKYGDKESDEDKEEINMWPTQSHNPLP